MSTTHNEADHTTPWSAEWIELVGRETTIRRLRNSLHPDYRVVTGLYILRVLVPDIRKPDFELLCDAYTGLTAETIIAPPANEQAPCGLYVIMRDRNSLVHHSPRCKGCRSVEKRPPIQYRKNPVTTVLSAPSLAGNLSRDGLITAMRLASSDALELASEYEKAIAAIERLPELDEEMAALQARRLEHQQAITFFLKDDA